MDPNPTRGTADPAAAPLSTADGDTRPRAAAGDDYAFLSPAGRPDEIGRLGPYRVLAVLGRGGMGVVFRAEDPALQRQVALKVMLPGADADPRAKGRFLREARAQAKVEHEHVAVIHYVGEANGVPFIAMPLLKGMPLSQALRLSPKVPLGELVRIGREIADGLSAAHAAGLVHRDVKPANVWLDGPKRRVKLLDFGLARAEVTPDDPPATGPAGPAPSDALLTARGEVVGTPAFMSPEQARGERVDYRSDLFSLGVLLYEMATGKLPFTGRNSLEVLLAVAAHHPPAAHQANPDVPVPLSELIWRLMAKDPAGRPPTATAVAAELDALAGGLSAPRVRAVALPSLVQAAPDPGVWAELTTAGEPAAADEEPAEDAATEHVAPAGRAAGVPRWVWAVAGACALCAVGAGVWLARPKPKPVVEVAGDPPPVPALRGAPPKPKKPPTQDRLAAEVLKPYAGEMYVRLGSGPVTLRSDDPLPGEPFVLTGIAMKNEKLPADFCSKVLIPAVAELTEFRGITDWHNAMPVSEDDLARLAAAPVGAGITYLNGQNALTPNTIEVLKRFPKLAGARFVCRGADDALIARVKELNLTGLWFSGLEPATQVGEQTTAMLLTGRIEHLTLQHPTKIDRGLIRTVVAMPHLRTLNGGSIDDALLKEIAASRTIAHLWIGNDITDAGLKHLEAMPNLRRLDIQECKVTAAGAKALAEALPLCKISYSYQPGGVIEPKSVDEVLRKSVAALLKAGASVRVSRNGEPVDLRTAAELANVTEIRELVVTARSLTDPEAVMALKVFPAEAWDKRGLLGLGGAFTADQLRDVLRLPGPRLAGAIGLYGTKLPDAALAYLAELPNVHNVAVAGQELTAAGVGHLAALPKLGQLDLINMDIRPDALAPLRNTKLWYLDLRDCRNLDDTVVEHLAAVRGLRALRIPGTKVTKAGVEKLAVALPRCKIEWDGGTITPKPSPVLEREAAAALQPHFSSLGLRIGGKEVWVGPKDALPAEPFRLTILNEALTGLPKDFVGSHLLPALALAEGIEEIRWGGDRLRFTPHDLAQLAATPARNTLSRLGAYCRPDAGSVAALKQFPRLTLAAFNAGAATDEDIERLKELSTLQHLGLTHLGDRGPVSERKWAAVAAMPLRALSLTSNTQLDRRGGELLATMPTLEKVYLTSVPPDPAALGALARAGRLKSLQLQDAPPSGSDGYAALAVFGPETAIHIIDGLIDDNGLEPLTKLVGARNLTLNGTKLTRAGVGKLAAALPRCKIVWDGGTIEPGK